MGLRMCQQLGYHRQEALSKSSFEDEEMIKHAFWSLYVIERYVGLYLNQQPTLHTESIDLDLPAVSDDGRRRPWDLLMKANIKLAMIQESIYNDIYSDNARGLSSQARGAVLISVVPKLWRERSSIEIEVSRTQMSQRPHQQLHIG